MKLAVAAAITSAWVLSVALAAQDRPPASETVFKNIQVLKGIPVDDFMDTMGIMSAALGFDCSECQYGCRHRHREVGGRHAQESGPRAE